MPSLMGFGKAEKIYLPSTVQCVNRLSFVLAYNSKNKKRDSKTSAPTQPSLHHHINSLAMDSHESIIHLHDTIGDQAVQRLMRSNIGFNFSKIGIQSKLRLSQPDDVYEQEAERVAEQVIRMSSAECLLPSTTIGTEKSDLKNDQKITGDVEREIGISRKTRSFDTSNEFETANDIHNVVGGGGSPLEPLTRNLMESRFGFDFSKVRIHTDENAASAAQAINSKAFTVGYDIVFGSGQYAPNTVSGSLLLAHELAHIIQQNDLKYTLSERSANSESSHLGAKHTIKENATTTELGSEASLNKVIQRDILAYSGEHEEELVLPWSEGNRFFQTYAGEADGLRKSLLPLIESDKVGFNASLSKTYFFNRQASRIDLLSAFTAAKYPRAADMADALIDSHNVYIYSREKITKSPQFLWEITTNKESQVVERTTKRSLTNFEKTEARQVFGTSLNLENIILEEDPIMSLGGYYRTTPWTINVPPGLFSDPNFMRILIHELTHSWQYQHGVSLPTTTYHAIFSTYDYGKEPGLKEAFKNGKKFTDFNTEQQGDIVEDYYIRLKNDLNIDAWQPFIDQLRGYVVLPPIYLPKSKGTYEA
jgi:hypothetical protein